MKKLFILIFLISLNSFAQKYELGEVTIEELKQKEHTIDTSAVAAILFKKGEVNYIYSQFDGFFSETNVKMKVKVYKKEGTSWGNFEFPLNNESTTKQTINVRSAITYNLEEGKIEKSKLKSDGEFEEKINEFWLNKKIVLPNVKEGSIIEIDYTIKNIGMGTLDEWEFQENIPLDHVEYTTRIPEYYVYKTYIKGWMPIKINKENIYRKIVLKSQEINYIESKTIYSLEKVSAIKNEIYVNNIKNYTSSIQHELSMTKFPNAFVQTYSNDWDTVTRKIYEYDGFGPELETTGYFESDINELLKTATSPLQKAGLIFNFVKNKMSWNERYGYGCLNGVKKAYKENTGNVADINLMLTSMLRYAGLKASPVLISTQSNGIALYPSRSAYNYVIAGIELENQVVLLDATNKYALPGILPIRVLNWYGRIIRDYGSSATIELMPKSASNDVVNLIATIKPDGEIFGKIREQYFDYNAYIFRNNYNGISKESYISKLEKDFSGLEITDYSVQNSNDLTKPIVENYSFTNNNSTEIIGNKIYFSPLLFLVKTENPFKQDKREFPVDFSIPFSDSYNIVINIPEDYEVESLIESIKFVLPENYGHYIFNITSNVTSIQISTTFNINAPIIPVDKYEALKEFYKVMIEKQNEKIVLKKKV